MCGEGSSGSPDVFYEGTGRISLKLLREQFELARAKGFDEVWVEGRYEGCNSMHEWLQWGEWQEVEYWDVALTEETVYNKAPAVGSPQEAQI